MQKGQRRSDGDGCESEPSVRDEVQVNLRMKKTNVGEVLRQSAQTDENKRAGDRQVFLTMKPPFLNFPDKVSSAKFVIESEMQVHLAQSRPVARTECHDTVALESNVASAWRDRT